jgi:thymidylate synthase (FAD)
MKIIKQSATLEFITPDALNCIEKIGRVCYKSENLITEDSNKTFVKKLLDPVKKHESVLEHAFATFRFITDRGVTHEMVRHRIASYSQESTRYCNYSKDKFGSEITVILPVRFSKVTLFHNLGRDIKTEKLSVDEKFKFDNWLAGIEDCERHYFKALELGDKPQEARDLLPNSLKTEIVMTANFREWRHFFKLRTAPSAHPQMRALASDALEQIRREVKILFDEENL